VGSIQHQPNQYRLTLVLHEYLWMTGADDTNFKLSNPIIAKLNIPDYSPSLWQNNPGTAFATAECTGQMADGSYITVSVTTKGATKAPDHGEVRIEKGGNKFGYNFKAEEMSQFFEFDDAKGNTAMVGLTAAVGREFPIVLKYSGLNYVDMDLKVVLQNPVKDQGNFMHVWKGPSYDATEQYLVENPVCSVWSNN
jgi:hypothetical protein